MRAQSLQLCPTLCDPTDCSPSASSVHGVPRREYWSGLPCLPPGELPNPGIEPISLISPVLAGRFFTTRATWEALLSVLVINNEYYYLHYNDEETDSEKDPVTFQSARLVESWDVNPVGLTPEE